MSKFATLLLLIFAGSLVASCQTTANVTDGSGFEMLHPSPATRKFIVANDLPFAQEVVAHNSTCANQAGCRKD